MRKSTMAAAACLLILFANLAFADIIAPGQNNTPPSPRPILPSPVLNELVLMGAGLVIIAAVAWLLIKKFLRKSAKKSKSRR